MGTITYGDLVLAIVLLGGTSVMVAVIAIKEEIEKQLNK